MLLWTIQPLAVYEQILRDGVYRYTEVSDDEDIGDFSHAYEWLNAQMAEKVGPAPQGVIAPMRGWLRWEVERPRPDLRWMRWNWGPWGEHVLLQVDIPEEQVLFMDIECWYIILNNALIDDSEEESERLEAVYRSLPPEEQQRMLRENWQRAFDIEYAEGDDWRGKGFEVEALFWELRKEQIRSVKHFTSRPSKVWRNDG